MLNSMTESAMTGEVRALQLACIRLQTSLWQVRRKACAEDAQQMGWDKLLRAVPPQLEHSENMLAELFEVSATQRMRVCSWRLSRHIRMLQVSTCRFLEMRAPHRLDDTPRRPICMREALFPWAMIQLAPMSDAFCMRRLYGELCMRTAARKIMVC